jgi:hypothetical protein
VKEQSVLKSAMDDGIHSSTVVEDKIMNSSCFTQVDDVVSVYM